MDPTLAWTLRVVGAIAIEALAIIGWIAWKQRKIRKQNLPDDFKYGTFFAIGVFCLPIGIIGTIVSYPTESFKYLVVGTVFLSLGVIYIIFGYRNRFKWNVER